MTLELSLVTLDHDLSDLYDMRDDAQAEFELGEVRCIARGDAQTLSDLGELRHNVEVLDVAIRNYMEALPRKVDAVGDAIAIMDSLAAEPKVRNCQHCDGSPAVGTKDECQWCNGTGKEKTLCQLDQEIKRLTERRDAIRRRVADIRSMVIYVMDQRQWKPGQTKKLEGNRRTLMLKGNGGKRPVLISDESLVPDEYCVFEGRIPAFVMQSLSRFVSNAGTLELQRDFAGLRLKRVPSLTLIAQALEQKCGSCRGIGSYDVTSDNSHEEYQSRKECACCGGSGLAGVPGCALGERGSTVVCR